MEDVNGPIQDPGIFFGIDETAPFTVMIGFVINDHIAVICWPRELVKKIGKVEEVIFIGGHPAWLAVRRLDRKGGNSQDGDEVKFATVVHELGPFGQVTLIGPDGNGDMAPIAAGRVDQLGSFIYLGGIENVDAKTVIGDRSWVIDCDSWLSEEDRDNNKGSQENLTKHKEIIPPVFQP